MYAVKECGVCHYLPSFRRMPRSADFHKGGEALILVFHRYSPSRLEPRPRGEKR